MPGSRRAVPFWRHALNRASQEDTGERRYIEIGSRYDVVNRTTVDFG